MCAYPPSQHSAAVSFADVTSSNIVGYNQLNTIANDMTIYGAQWQTPAGGNINIQYIKLPVDQCSDEGTELLYVYTPGTGYEIYYYYTESVEDISIPEEDWVFKGPAWCTVEGQYVGDVLLPAGSAFWLSTAAACNFTVAGAVPVANDGVRTLETKADAMSLYSIPFPIAGTVNNVKLLEGCTDEGTELLYVYTPGTGYEIYYYYTESVEDISLPEEDWVFKGPAWCTMEGQYVNIPLALGQGFWLSTAQDLTFTVESPVK